MNFLVDLTASQPNNDGKYHGGGKYAKKIFIDLVKFNPSHVRLFGLFDSEKTLDSEIEDLIRECKITLLDIRRNSIQDVIRINNISRFYSALPFDISFNFSDVFQCDCDVIGTIHGLRELETKMNFNALKYMPSKGEWLKNLIKIVLGNYVHLKKYRYYGKLLKRMKVVTVSNHSKYSIKSYYPKVDDVNVFYSPDVTHADNKASFPLNQENYFLMVSGNRWVKNNLISALALDQLFSEHPEITQSVVITGVSNPKIYLKRLVNKNRFTFYNYVDEAFLDQLYQKSFAFIYMTLNEGFGYPPIEAMKYSVPVIASPFTSLTEICGDAALYSNPHSINEIKNRVLQLYDTDMYKICQKKSQQQYNYIKSIQEEDSKKLIEFLLKD